jgi:hypothetical protein
LSVYGGLIAAAERQARADSQDRQERIKVLLDLITRGKLVPKGEESEDSTKDLKSEVQEYFAEQAPELAPGEKPVLPRPAREEKHKSRLTNELAHSLIELVQLQKGEIEYFQRFKRKWEEIEAYDAAGLERLLATAWRARVGEPKYERRRRGYCRDGVGLIEYEFGGEGEAWWRRGLVFWSGVPYEPTCLDDILRGGVGEVRTLPGIAGAPVPSPPVTLDTRTNMQRLEELFGMDRKRFPKKLQLHRRKKSREIVYEWRGVVEIMLALLKETLLSEKRRKGKKPGPPKRTWLEKPEVRSRVLSGIEKRIKVVCTDPEIARAFLDLIQEFKAS